MRVVKIIAAVCLLCLLLPVAAQAQDDTDLLSQQAEAAGAGALYDALDDDVRNALADFGLDGVNFDQIFSLTPGAAVRQIRALLTGQASQSAGSVGKLAAVILLLAIADSFLPEDEKLRACVSTAGVLVCVGIVCTPLISAAENAASAVMTTCAFIKLLIPVLAGLLIASGSPAAAAGFQSLAFAAAQLISSAAGKFAIPVIGAITSLDLAGALLPQYHLARLPNLVRKSVAGALSFTAALYVSFLGIRHVLADTADTMSVRGVQLLIGSAVPIVGSALSDVCSGILGSLAAARSGVAVFGILVILLVALPPLVQLLFWIFLFKAAAAMCEMLTQKALAGLFSSLAGVLTLINTVLILNTALFMISVALLLSVRR